MALPKKLEHAWKCIIDQYFSLACDVSMREGKGINIFRFLKKNDGESNCYYYYSKSDGCTWEDIKKSSEEWLFNKYDPDSMVLICVQIPSDNVYEDETIGNIKLFSIDGTKEILERENMIIKKCEDKKNTGLRKRNIPS